MSSSEDEDELPQDLRPSPESIQKSFEELFKNPLLSLPYLKEQAIRGQIKSLKSLHWRFFFSLLPIQTTNYSLILERSRTEYDELRQKFLRSPDELLDGNKNYSSRNDVNNPLSLDIESPWVDWFDSLELRRVILQDVERTFQELPYFRLNSTMNLVPEISYKQGMNELLALILLAVDSDSLPSPSTNSLALLVLSPDHIEHDTWSLFSALMKSTKQFYDYTPSVSIPVDRTVPTSTFSSPSSPLSPSSTTLVQPLVATSIRIYDQLLKAVDITLWQKMESMKIEPQLYLTKWLRLLFLREFPDSNHSTVYQLWTSLFAEDPSLRLVEQISVIMILRIRDALISTQDYSEFLMSLLRYPLPDEKDFRISLLIEQAIYLRDQPTSLTGEKLRNQNREMGANLGKINSDYVPRPRSSNINNVNGTAPMVEGGGIVGDIAKGVYETAEAFGINKALFGTLNEIRKGVVAQQQRSPQNDFSNFPSSLPLPPPPPQPVPPASKSDNSLLQKLKNTNLAMSKALEICAASLEKDLQLNTGVESNGEGFMALTVLAHIRDVLSGSVTGGFDEGVLKPLLQQRSTSTNAAVSTSLASPSQVPATTSVTSTSQAVSIPSTSTVPVIRKGEPNLLLGNRNYQPSASLSRTPQTSSKPLPSPNLSTKISTVASVGTVSSNVRPSLSSTLSTTKVLNSIPTNIDVNLGFPPSGFSTRSGVLSSMRGVASRVDVQSIDVDPLGAMGGK